MEFIKPYAYPYIRSDRKNLYVSTLQFVYLNLNIKENKYTQRNDDLVSLLNVIALAP